MKEDVVFLLPESFITSGLTLPWLTKIFVASCPIETRATGFLVRL